MKKNRLIRWLSQNCLRITVLICLVCIATKKTNAQNPADASKPKIFQEQLPAQPENKPVKQGSPQYSIINFLKTNKSFAEAGKQAGSGTTYRFTGKGDWNSAANWENHSIPPSMLKPGDHVIIDGSGPCLLNDSKPFLISKQSSVEIQPGKELYVAIGNNFILKGDLTNNGKLTVISGTLLTGLAQESQAKKTGQLRTTSLSKIEDKKMLPAEIKKD